MSRAMTHKKLEFAIWLKYIKIVSFNIGSATEGEYVS